MRILKIELQNINSLKSNEPIVIDFENEMFKDVGLYAITGPTGAGKTTILDAITIALYHTVPRFNNPSVKANLRDVVSYGADEAMARISFENKGLRFEAHWSMRLTSKTGKLLGTPKEEVRLKDLSTGKIIGEKKTEVRAEVERITQLNYHQFLRSAMLAQGEFAAFLSASSTDKGKLLEQITGEDIYKKIGEAINIKKAAERKKLDEIRAKINSEDLLTEEVRQSLGLEQSLLIQNLDALDLDLKKVVAILNWYEKNAALIAEKEKLVLRTDQLEEEKLDNKWVEDLLHLHEKAEPHKELLYGLKHLEKELLSKVIRRKVVEDKLKDLTLQIDQVSVEKETREIFYKETAAQFNLWLPKLEQISNLDSSLFHLRKQEKQLTNEWQAGRQSIEKWEDQHRDKAKLREENLLKVDQLKQFLDAHKNTLLLEVELGKWQAEFALRKRNVELWGQIKTAIDQKKTLLGQTDLKLKDVQVRREAAQIGYEQSSQNLQNTIRLLDNDPLDVLLSQRELLVGQLFRFKEGRRLAQEALEFKSGLQKLMQLQEELDKGKKSLLQQRTDLQDTKTKAEISLADARKIWELESRIKDFEAERQKLVEAQPCPLCGSLEHPYVQHYLASTFSESQVEVDRREVVLKQITEKEKQLDLDLMAVQTRIEATELRKAELNAELQKNSASFNVLEIDQKIEDLEYIENQHAEYLQRESDLAGKIKVSQELQKSKDKWEAECKKITAALNEFTHLEASFLEKAKSLQHDIDQRQQEFDKIQIEIEDRELSLREELAHFQLALPAVEESTNFVAGLQKEIVDYHAKEKQCDHLASLTVQLSGELSGFQNQITDKNLVIKRLDSELIELQTKLKTISEERNTLLPLEVSVEQKRNQLQEVLEIAKSKLDDVLKRSQLLQTAHVSSSHEMESLAKEMSQLNEEILKLNVEMDVVISSGDFASRMALVEALLPAEDKNRYQSMVKSIENKMLEIKALSTQNQQDILKLEIEKDFEITANEAHQRKQLLENEKKQLLERTGEIKEKFQLDEQIKVRNQSVYMEISKQELVVKKWNDLMNLLGGSKDAFNTYVQRLTLHNLIQLANVHLFKLNKRYSLRMDDTYKPGEELYFKLIDHYQTDEARYVDTSSGGEKFLISLALALGLSDLASNNVSIDSLFIDEGFGTLDTQTLETVISTLETLQAQGKMIGIISHVDTLKERIPAQIRVVKKSHGVSEVEIN